MQDFIFNSRKQNSRRRKRAVLRLIVIALLAGIGLALANHFLDLSLTGNDGEQKNRDQLPLPPVNDTQPALSLQPDVSPSHAASPPANATDNEPAETTSSIASAASSPDILATDTDTGAGEQKPKELTPPPEQPSLRWVEHRIGKGDTLANIFKQQELSPSLLHQIVNGSKAAGKLARINPGQLLRFALDEDGELQQLILERNRVTSLQISRSDEGFETREVNRPVTMRVAQVSGVIESSLFVDGQKAGLSDAQIMELAQIFGWDIDFALELREGDQFHLIHEEQYLDGEKLGNGPILAAEFTNRGTTYRAIRYTDKSGGTAYYDPQGHAKRRAFIRTPVKFARISSRFTRKRWHPVLKRWRSHKGVDYAAPKGTPVKATGNGKVVFRGRKGGYGNVIFLRHGGKYTTVYGHLSRFAKGLKTGSKVKQGQIIGYVGSTGLATGPHLHYEFRVNGVHRNPLTIKLPKSIRLPKSEMARFQQQTQPVLAQLDELRAKTMVASAR